MKPKFGVVVFPGSNCDHDAYYALKHELGYEVEFLWHKEHSLKDCNVIILPGGFSYGDYIRCGAVAKLSPIMREVIRFANDGGIVIGICNGFQILCETGLLPGVLIKNRDLKFICEDVYLKVTGKSKLFADGNHNSVFKIPIAHGEGNYFIEEEKLAELESNNQVLFRYCTAVGEVSDSANPNGSLNNIAGITNVSGNVLGMMPHPERACSKTLGNDSGKFIFLSIAEFLKTKEVENVF
ncbi:MAG: phosphoribosylformylglycinamidine synthase subunit PurQ [Bacteroidetes bacterium]|nr:phosphoribosylformylglycinamidine synthase subunit PurQ [Bacteroidota bacterium]